MPVPAAVSQWIAKTYPKPKVDPEWLTGCYEYVADEDPGRTMEDIINCVENLLLLSNFEDSMLPNSGFPAELARMEKGLLKGPILVEVVAMTEIGHSAFNLTNVRQTRIDRADLAGMERGDEEDQDEGYQDPDDEAPVPNYPRSMLKFTLSDGSTTISGMEFERLPEIVLGETPLGCKMLLKDVLIRRGIAFLEPDNVIFKGHHTEDRVANQDRDFVADLRARVGLPAEDPDTFRAQDHPRSPPRNPAQAMDVNVGRRAPAPVPVPPRAPAHRAASPRTNRAPLREVSDPPEPSTTLTNHADDDNVTLRRRVPTAHHTLNPPKLDDAAVEQKRSRFFPTPEASSSKTLVENPSAPISNERIFSPLRPRASVIDIPSSPESEDKVASSSTLPRGTQTKPKSEPLPTQALVTSDFDFDDDMDDAYLAEVTKMEQDALDTARPRRTATPAAASSTTLSNSQESNPIDVIVIEDNDDKENVPVAARRVRRRVPHSSQVQPEDIIDISD